MAIVRLLLFAALAVIAGALVLYGIKRDRRYLRFVVEVAKYTVIVLLVILFLPNASSKTQLCRIPLA